MWFSVAVHANLERHAFVVGNAEYEHQRWLLENPYNDAQDMAKALRKLGFKVHQDKPLLDLTKSQFNKELEDFSSGLPESALVVVYFAGHGITWNRENYLIPVESSISNVNELAQKAISLRNVLTTLLSYNNTGYNILLLDACRDTPLQGKETNGLIKLNSIPDRTFIGYAANEGETASDGDGRNGTFTSALLHSLNKHSHDAIDVLFRKVSARVKKKTRQLQNPIADNQISEEVCFSICKSPSNNKWLYVVAGAAAIAVALLAGRDDSQKEIDSSFTLTVVPPNP